MSESERLYRGKPSLTLTGFMFSGKSSVGRELARRLGLEFVDLDTRIVSRAGKSIERIFAEEGEAAFRLLEREAVERALPRPGRVIAAGGGAIVDPDNRALIREHSLVIWLRATPETVLERWRTSRGRVRPLLTVEDPVAEVRRLLEARRPFYEECDLAVDTDGLGVEEVAGRVVQAIGSGE